MATIEERAYKAFCGRTSCRPDSKIHSFCINCLHDSRKDAYIKGAIEQREIDIKNACEFLREIGAFSTLSFYDDEGVSQEVYEEMFRNAMMEG